jgi:type III secretion system low calcium response chaperone LcrH/SycD
MKIANEGFIEQYAEAIAQHGTLKEPLEITDQEMIDAYEQALEAYNQGDYESAVRQFTTLTLIDPQEADLHLATGNALQQLGEHRLAFGHFSAAATLSPADPGPLFRIAECQLALSMDHEARETLRECLRLCAADTSRPGLHQQACALMETLF